jgi:hypothetical protein
MKTHRLKLEIGGALLFLYLLAFVRQYFWVIDSNVLAWTLSILLTSVVWYFYVSTRQFPAERFGRGFWVLVGLPLLAFYLLRAAFPDHSFDVLSYHLLHSERSLHGPLFAPGDFFSSPAPFNPAPDTLAGLSRLLLGFRLGTVINLFVLLWAAQVVDKILRPFVERPWLRSACVLLTVMAEQLFFEISTYMVDLMALPLMLEATLLTLRFDEARNRPANFIHVAVLLGASAAFKLTNLAVALPLVAVCAYKMTLGSRRFTPKQLITTALLAGGAFLAPLLPFSLYIFRITGNPIFPLANGFFKSAYWPTSGAWDNRWGPQTLWQIIAWPLLVWFKPERYSELAVYSGRLSIGCVVSLAGLLLAWHNERVRILCFTLLSSSLLWSAIALGYSRYGLYEELLAGVTVVAVSCALTRNILWTRLSWRVALASIFCIALTVQAYFACNYVLQKEWGSRATIFTDPQAYLQDAKLILRDRSLGSFLTAEERALFDPVQVWVETCPKSTGFEVLLNPRAPIVAARQPEYFVTRESWRQFIRVVDQTPSQRMFSLCLNDDLPTARQTIAQRGLEVGILTPVNLPFFSPGDRIGMMLIEVRVPQEPGARNEFESAWLKGAFAPSVYREEIVALEAPSAMHPGEKKDLRFKVRNLGNQTWPAVGTKDFRYQINMGDRWITGGTRTEDNRAVMSGDLPPGAETQITLTVHAPQTPGEYALEIDMVHEGVTWFSERGARPLRLNVRVAP